GVTMVAVAEEEEALSRAREQLRSTANPFRVHKSLREARLRELATLVGAGEVGARVRALAEHREAFIRVDRYICSEETGVKCDIDQPQHSDDRARIAEERFGETVFAPFTD